jgi:serralysin
MRACYRILLVLSGVVALTMLAGSALAADKSVEAAERHWNPLSGGQYIMSDVAEVEPNGSLATAQLLNCGDVLRPASISAAGDTDYVYFTATAGTIITVGTDADGTTGQLVDSRIRLFNASGAVLASDDDSGPGAYSLLTFTATYTGVYYVGIAGYSASYFGIYKAFITCQVPQPPPVNDQCAGALPIECGAVDLSGSTQFATADYTPYPSGLGGCTGYPAVGKDVVYVINATGGDVLDVNYTSAADGSIYLITNCADPQGSCVAGADATLTGVAEHLVYNVTTSGTYYLILDNYGTGAGGAYTLVGSYTCPATAANRKTWGSLKTIYR